MYDSEYVATTVTRIIKEFVVGLVCYTLFEIHSRLSSSVATAHYRDVYRTIS